jgi:hypothetical protein
MKVRFTPRGRDDGDTIKKRLQTIPERDLMALALDFVKAGLRDAVHDRLAFDPGELPDHLSVFASLMLWPIAYIPNGGIHISVVGYLSNRLRYAGAGIPA